MNIPSNLSLSELIAFLIEWLTRALAEWKAAQAGAGSESQLGPIAPEMGRGAADGVGGDPAGVGSGARRRGAACDGARGADAAGRDGAPRVGAGRGADELGVSEAGACEAGDSVGWFAVLATRLAGAAARPSVLAAGRWAVRISTECRPGGARQNFEKFFRGALDRRRRTSISLRYRNLNTIWQRKVSARAAGRAQPRG
jgi:hypothetical protein